MGSRGWIGVAVVFVIALVVAVVKFWLMPTLEQKAKYDGHVQSLEGELLLPMRVKIFDDRMTATIKNIESRWKCVYSESDTHHQALSTAGLPPTIDQLIELFCNRLPEFSWFSTSDNLRSYAKGMLVALLFPVTEDHTFHVSSERKVALVWHNKQAVTIYRMGESGLRESLWADPQAIADQEAADDSDEPRK